MPEEREYEVAERSAVDEPVENEAGEKDASPVQVHSDEKRLPIVGIGTSAGGLAALKTFFDHVPTDSGLAYVVVIHLSPEHESHLPELLQPHVRIPVQQVTKTTALEPNQVYVIPPNANLNTIDTHLRLSALEEQRRERAPIDHFFRTLATCHDGNAIGVILTGTGSDGTLGIREIKSRGGLTVVQEPSDAEYDGMPQSAIATGLVDLILPITEMPKAILDFAKTKPAVPLNAAPDDLAPETRNLLQKIFAQLRARTNRDFSRYKYSTILRRIQRRMQLRGVEELSAYLQLLREQPDEVRLLADDLLVTVTNFFRDPEVFKALKSQIVPSLFENKASGDRIRVWSVGCATGEEAYSLAILLLEEASHRETAVDVQVFASDLHERSLTKAREGFYPGDIQTDVSVEWLKKYFHREDGGYRVRKEVRESVVFAPHNLMGDPPFSRMDLISCRNLLIYLQRDVQREVVELFHYALNPDGALVLGTSETLEATELFQLEDKKNCIYRKRNVPPPELRLPVFPLSYTKLRNGGGSADHDFEPIAYGLMHQRMVEDLAPPSLLVSPDDRVVHLSQHAGRYLLIPGGDITASIFKLVRPELRAELGVALQAARQQSAPVVTRPIRVRFNGETAPVVLRVRSASAPQRDGFVLVIFQEVKQGEVSDQKVAGGDTTQLLGARSEKSSSDQVDVLQSELEMSRQHQQSIIEEYETSQEELKASNEELQSSNEELRSTLEELETSKEELQSMNEELQTANQENRHKVEELAQLSGDLQNLMAATDIATLFLDRELRILRFTPQISKLFNVRMTDRGRPLTDLTHRLGYNNLHLDAEQVLEQLVPIEREVQDENGGWYMCRVLPYRSTTDHIEGVVITFVDITSRVKAESAVRESEERFRALVDASAQMVWATDAKGGVVDDSPSWRTFTGQTFEQWKGLGWLDAVHPDDRAGVKRDWQHAIENQTTLAREFRVYHEPTGDYRWTTVRAVPLRDRNDAVRGWIGMNIDITEQKRNEATLRQADQRKNEFIATLAHELRNPLTPIRTGIDILTGQQADPEQVAKILATLERQTDQLETLVGDLLDVSRITRGTFRLRTRLVELNDVLRNAVEASRPFVDAAKHQLTVEYALEPVLVEADPNRLAQVLTNLLNNAAKYTSSGGKIWLTTEREGGEVLLTVRDTGVGIETEKLSHIFEMFSQIEHHHEQYAGLGVGLTLAKQLVEMHGGQISAISEGEGTGSAFLVRLPVADGAVQAKEDMPPSEQPEGRTPELRVLVADDNRDIATTMTILIQALGHQVRTAADGREAIERAEEFDPNVIIMDLGMPNMDGYEAARQIRQRPWSKGMMLIALSGWGQEEDRKRTKAAGFDHHLVKPASRDQLKALFAEYAAK